MAPPAEAGAPLILPFMSCENAGFAYLSRRANAAPEFTLPRSVDLRLKYPSWNSAGQRSFSGSSGSWCKSEKF